MNINYFENFVDLWTELGLSNNFREPNFFIFKFSSLKDAKNYITPYRRGFYQISLLENRAEACISVNTYQVSNFKQVLCSVAPEPILSWDGSMNLEGFVILFKGELLGLSDEEVKRQFSFFSISHKNIVEIDDTEMYRIKETFETLFKKQEEGSLKYFKELIKLQLSILLYNCQEIYESKVKLIDTNTISDKFMMCVDNHYLEIKAVEGYANLMNLSNSRLSQIVKKETGQTAKKIIAKRIILEAKKMLLYTNLTIAEIAYKLGFDEPTHFGRFFKKQEGISPKAFRDRA